MTQSEQGQPVPWETYKAEHCDISIRYRSGKSWTKFTTPKAARFLSRKAVKQATAVEIEVRICVEAYTQKIEHPRRVHINYSHFEIHKWTRETGWTLSHDMTNNGYLY